MTTVSERMKSKHDNTILTMSTQPTMAKLELTTECNLKCRFCANHKLRECGGRSRRITDRDFELFFNFIEQIPSIKEVGLYGLGESSLHPQIGRYYHRLKWNGYFTYLTTNGVNISNLKNAIRTINSLKFSWNYKDAEDFIEKTGGSYKDYNQIIQNINSIHFIADTVYDTRISISTVLDIGESPDDYTEALSQLKYHEQYFVPVLTQGGVYEKGSPGGPVTMVDDTQTIPCWTLFNGLYVDCELNVRTCPYGNLSDEFILGNIMTNSVEEILEQRDQYKKMHLEGQIPSMCKKCLKQE